MGILDPSSPKSPGVKAVPAPARPGRGQTFGTHEQPTAPAPASTPTPSPAELRSDTARAEYVESAYRSTQIQIAGAPNAGGQVGTDAQRSGHGGMKAVGRAPGFDPGLAAGYQAPAGGPIGGAASGPIPGPGPGASASRIDPAPTGATQELRERDRVASYSEPEQAFRMGGGAANSLPTGGPRGSAMALRGE